MKNFKSPLMQGRGLKLVEFATKDLQTVVAPHAGAWIETSLPRLPLAYSMSPLMQGRGLKLRGVEAVACRGPVAPHAGAWIETCHG